MRFYSHFVPQWALLVAALLVTSNVPMSLAQDDRHAHYRTREKQYRNHVADRLYAKDHQDSAHVDTVDNNSNVRTLQAETVRNQHARKTNEDSEVQLRDQTYHISKPQQRERPAHIAGREDNDISRNVDPDLRTVSTKHHSFHRSDPRENQPPQDRVQDSNTQGAREKSHTGDMLQRTKHEGNDLTVFRTNDDENANFYIHDPTGDGNVEFSTKESPQVRTAAAIDPTDKMPVVYGSVAAFLLACLYILLH